MPKFYKRNADLGNLQRAKRLTGFGAEVSCIVHKFRKDDHPL